jgi:endonuclease G
MRNQLLLLLVLLTLKVSSQTIPQKISKDNQIVEHLGFTLSYNETCEQANWVRYVLTPANLEDKDLERKSYFKQDIMIEDYSAKHEDYTRTGYDRGHLKPAGDELYSQRRKDATFIMSNVAPQYPGFNRGIWKRLEEYVRETAIESDSIIVVTGGILDDSLNTIDSNICIPTNFYKVLFIYNDGKCKKEAYIMPNTSSKHPISTYKVDMRVLEIKAGLKFL